jgi:glutamine synthetase
MPTTLRLKPDYSTLRVAPWLSKEAYIISDLYHPDEDKPIDFAPRTILKEALLKPSFVSSSCIKQLTFQLSKVSSDSPPLADQLTSNNQGVLMTDNIHFDMINSLSATLREVGVPINSIQPV